VRVYSINAEQTVAIAVPETTKPGDPEGSPGL